MASPVQQLALVGPRALHRRSMNRASMAAWPRVAAVQVIGLIVLAITAILAVVPSALGVIIGFDFLIFDRLGIA